MSGAQALGRGDIGRLCAGAKADMVLVDAAHPAVQPLHDPLRSLVYVAADRAVRDVFVDGRQVMADGRVLALAQQRALAGVPRHDHARRSAEEMSPRSLVLAERH